jgi:glycosyltransferase involved in cell wall biosynthesis
VIAPTRLALGAYVPARTRSWAAHSRLFVVGDELGWSIDDDRARLTATARRLGYTVAPARWARYARRQSVFLPNHFDALQPRWLSSSHRLGLSYFHGAPGTPGYPEFERAYDALRSHSAQIDRVQVTHAALYELVTSAGVEPAKVFRIPIGVDIERFPLGDGAARTSARARLGLPASSFVVGSFQKDGVGFGAGDEPKLIKGPDVLVAVLERLRAAVPELHVVLTGRARGYVRRELERLGIPYRHTELATRDGLASVYHALDAYVVTSRQEGGPKAVLESMAAGVPLVTTRVGQAPELARHTENALLADVDDVEGLTASLQRLYEDGELRARLRAAGRVTAEAYADDRLDPLWAKLFDGFVARAA